MHLILGNFIQLAIFLVSISVYFRKPIPKYLKFFPIYFFLQLITDLILDYTSDHGIHNNILTNPSAIAEFTFYYFVLRELIINVKVKKVILYTMVIYALFALINIFLIQGYEKYNAINFTMGVVITVVFCIYYFFELFQKTETPSLIGLPGFWIVCAILINNVLTFPIFALLSFMNELTKSNQKTSQVIFDNITTIFNIISIITYILYSIGFLCRIRSTRAAV
jgi:hypothetical protein